MGDRTVLRRPRRAATTIFEAAQDAAAIVQRLRAFYRAAGEGDERMGLVDLSDLVTQAVAFTQPRWRDQALARGATIAVEVDRPPVPRSARSAPSCARR